MSELVAAHSGTTLTLNRPDKMNALSGSLVDALLALLRQAHFDGTRLVILRGAGRNFNASDLALPGLHIAEVVCREIKSRGWQRIGLLGTNWTMTGPVYAESLQKLRLQYLIPDEPMRKRLDAAIFDELCQGVSNAQTTELFLKAIDELKSRGAECVILGCTEIPLIVTADNSPLPILDSTRLLAQYGVREALNERPVAIKTGWMAVAP